MDADDDPLLPADVATTEEEDLVDEDNRSPSSPEDTDERWLPEPDAPKTVFNVTIAPAKPAVSPNMSRPFALERPQSRWS